MWPPPHLHPPAAPAAARRPDAPGWALGLDFLPEPSPVQAQAQAPAQAQAQAPPPPSIQPMPQSTLGQAAAPAAFPPMDQLDMLAMLAPPPAAAVRPTPQPPQQPQPPQPPQASLGSQLLDQLQYTQSGGRPPEYGIFPAPQAATAYAPTPVGDSAFTQLRVDQTPLQSIGATLHPPPPTSSHPGAEQWPNSLTSTPFSTRQTPIPSTLDRGDTSHQSWPAAWPDPADLPPGRAAEYDPPLGPALHAPTSSADPVREDRFTSIGPDRQSSSGAVKAVRGPKLKSRTGRRQNSACDACRASKKGCDLQVNVTYDDIGVTVKPLVKCSTCRRRGIECTTHEVHLIKSANGHFRPNGALSATAQARLAALSSSLSASMGARPSDLISPGASHKRRRAADSPHPSGGRNGFGPEVMSSALFEYENGTRRDVKAEEGDGETSAEGTKLMLQPTTGFVPTTPVSLFQQLEAFSSIPGTSRTIASINQSSMSNTLISRTLSLYSSIMEGPMALWLSREVSNAKPVFSVDEIQRRLLLVELSAAPASQVSSPPTSDATATPTSSRRSGDNCDDTYGPSGARRLLGILKDARASWAEWTSAGSNLGIGLADADGADSSTPAATPNLVFAATILDAAFEADIDPAQAGRNLESPWAQRARWRTWNEINEAIKALLTSFGTQYLISANNPSSPGLAPLHLLTQRTTWLRARDLLRSLVSVPSFRVAFALLLFSSIPPPFNASVASRAKEERSDADAEAQVESGEDEYLSDRAAQDCRFAADRGTKLMEQLVMRARKLCTEIGSDPRKGQFSPSWSSSRTSSESEPSSLTTLVPTLMGLLETMSFFTLILDSHYAMSHRAQSFMSMAFAEQCINLVSRQQGLEYFNTHPPQPRFYHHEPSSSSSLVQEVNQDVGGSLQSPFTYTPSLHLAQQNKHTEASASLAQARVGAATCGGDLMNSIQWANALKIYLWRQVSVLQELVHSDTVQADEVQAAVALGVDIMRRQFGTFGRLVEASIGAFAQLDDDTQMMLYYLVLHSTLGAFHLIGVLDELCLARPEWDMSGIIDPSERAETIALSTGCVAKVALAIRRAARSRRSGGSPRSKTDSTSAPHVKIITSEAPSIWNHPMLFAAFDAFFHAALFSARVWADQLSVPSHTPHVRGSASPAGIEAVPRLAVARDEAETTRATLVVCISALDELTHHVPSLLSWRNARRVTEVQAELKRLDRMWEAVAGPAAEASSRPHSHLHTHSHSQHSHSHTHSHSQHSHSHTHSHAHSHLQSHPPPTTSSGGGMGMAE